MKKAATWLLLSGGVSWSQPFWIERLSERFSPPFQAQVYRLSLDTWAIVLRIHMEAWLPYVFDTLIPLQLQISTAKGWTVETLITLPPVPQWEGSIIGRFPASLAGEMTTLSIHFSEAPEGPLYTRTHWRSGYTPIWIESVSCVLSPPVRLRSAEGRSWIASPGDSLWKAVLLPAEVDTSIPALPYLVGRHRRSPPLVGLDCAWYLRGDTTQVFWTCGENRLFYSLRGSRHTSPPPSRWQEAYQLFSDKKPGERSDRGLIYLFYGPPPLRLLSSHREIWVYPEENVSFHFMWEKGEWQLMRRLEYKAIWEKKI
ncbi:MAG: GWxTD domain-containing protein [Bacteroidia bacterium]|nr:hypothetical protein [Bacteroidia bacterium]MDW8014776.1 GWxTD domain-containing protein [Bacteroidia bacterium]